MIKLATSLIIPVVLLTGCVPAPDNREEKLIEECLLVGYNRTGESSYQKSGTTYQTVKQFLCPDTGIEMIVTWER